MKTLRNYCLIALSVLGLGALSTSAFARDYYDRGYDSGDYSRDSGSYHRGYRHGSDVSVGVRYSGRSHYSGRRHSVEAQVQAALARRGFYHGPIDGDIGRGSRHAIYHYQISHRLPASGHIDRYLLRSLGI